MKPRPRVALAAVIIFVSLVAGHEYVKATDFDRICRVFSEFSEGVSISGEDLLRRFENLEKDLHSVVYSPQVIWLMDRVVEADPSERYRLMQDGVFELRGEAWDCPAYEQTMARIRKLD